ncbi:hypothetical protein [Aquella oligotrophica]|uniref:Uncharacterized protein n=1 Tax=Aquella oligotrophica TaxID=2067065 RepID=A0A2I7N4C9_9NEIS|nr:hypothetical protein [Aquella oligotrophica]AUR51313.1 hypothetical protein CUN60_03020 [Aquella oligotrophica]
MNNEIILFNAAGNYKIETEKFILGFKNEVNISIEPNFTSTPDAIVFRSWYGEEEWRPSPEASISLTVTPISGDSIWLKPMILEGTSLSDAKIKATRIESPLVYSINNSQKESLLSNIHKIVFKNRQTGIIFEIELPRRDISPIFQESIQITIKIKKEANIYPHGIICEPKAANLWVIR